jgi:hypothetical protein
MNGQGMATMTDWMLLAATLMSGAVPATQSAPPQCPRDAEPVPAAFAQWARSRIIPAGDAAPSMAIGESVDLALVPQADVKLAAEPGRASAPGDFAAMVRLTVTRPAVYRLALGSRAWVDVVQDGRAIGSVAHGHGPACSGIRKIVDFDLKPGNYVIQITGSPDATARLMIVAR